MATADLQIFASKTVAERQWQFARESSLGNLLTKQKFRAIRSCESSQGDFPESSLLDLKKSRGR